MTRENDVWIECKVITDAPASAETHRFTRLLSRARPDLGVGMGDCVAEFNLSAFIRSELARSPTQQAAE